MSQGKWHSKRAVLKDLTRATGINRFHENAFVIGERPPPSRIVEDDVPEMYSYGGVTLNLPNEFEKPDLDGITQMIRMVDKYDEKPDVIIKTDAEKKNDVESVITISKLNPDVDEFFPSNNLVAEAELKNKLVNDPKHLKDELQCDGKFKTQNDSMCIENGKTLPTEAVPVNNVVNFEQMKEKLKTKISSTSNTSCFKAKRERNLAIATLLKLHSQTPSSVSTKNDVKTETMQSSTPVAPLKLMPPNYFEKSPSLAKNTEVNDRTENNKIILTKNVNEKPIERNTNNMFNINNSSDTVSINNIAKAVNKNKEDTKDSADVNNSMESSESIYEDSVAKVTNWFESNSNKVSKSPIAKNLKDYETDHQVSLPVKPSSSIKSTQNKLNHPSQGGPSQPYIGQVTFRKKAGPKSNSPSLSVSDKTPRQTPSNAYIPSDYANELSKMYMERANAKKDLTDAIWTNLEKKLKAKDEIIRQQIKERKKKQDSSNNSDQTS